MSQQTGNSSSSNVPSSNQFALELDFDSRGLDYVPLVEDIKTERKWTKTSLKDYLSAICGDRTKNWKFTDGEKGAKVLFFKGLFWVLTAKYNNENDFDKGVFDAFKPALPTVNGLPNNFVPMFFNDDETWAICLARELVMNEYGNIGPAVKQSKCEHGIALLKKDPDTNNWKTHYCTAVIEFKMLEKSIILPEDSSGNTIRAITLLTSESKGPMLQALCYVWSWVWPSLRRMGREDKRSMPFLMIACEKEGNDNDASNIEGKKNKKKNYARYVRGDLIAPPTCGDVFTYTISSSSPVCEEACFKIYFEYLEAIINGFDICYNHMVTKQGSTMACLPLSGCELPHEISFLSDGSHNLQLVASPNYSTNVNFHSSQGDIWTAQMSVQELVSIQGGILFSSGSVDFETAEPEQVMSVVVKVSSTVTASPLIHPSACYEALKLLQRGKVDLGTFLCFVKLQHKNQSGLIMIMEDLSKQDYQVLKPNHQIKKLANFNKLSLWSAFTLLFHGVLWKAAELNCIFSDLRVGYDETSNVLVKFTSDGNIPDLKLIDFDSFVIYESLQLVDNHRYLVNTLGSAQAYLFLQVFILGYSYVEEQGQKDVEALSISLVAKVIFNESDDNPFPIQAVALLCDHYKVKFGGTNEEKEVPEAISAWHLKNLNRCNKFYHNSSRVDSTGVQTFFQVMVDIGMVSLETRENIDDTEIDSAIFTVSDMMELFGI